MMTSREIGSRLSGLLFVVTVPVFLIATNVSWAFHETRLYQYGFDKYEIPQVTGLVREELVRAASELVTYFDSGQELIDVHVSKGGETIALFNEREIHHLRDVKDLLHRVYWVQRLSLLYMAAYGAFLWARHRRSVLAGDLTLGSGLAVALVVMMGAASLLSFEALFVQFHLMSFSNDLWRLDPTTDYLLMMFPTDFWLDATLLVGSATVMESALLWTGSRLLSARLRDGSQEPATRE
ncbi:MAG: integral rane protein [Dehalococcoidia bacterium]|nr:integral rane protein [Dehalococcoidia bacterium]